ncbi:MAG: vWA domain-containing protein [Isosphaeraceae bacterium]
MLPHRRRSLRLLAWLAVGLFVARNAHAQTAPRGDRPADATKAPAPSARPAVPALKPAPGTPPAPTTTPPAVPKKPPVSLPLVVSKAKQSREQPRSVFLQGPGADRYDTEPGNWSEIPPWRQTSFYGIRARGQFFVYVVDCSGSMADEGRLARAKIELRRSIQTLQEPQRFQVIFYNDEAIPMPGGLPKPADLVSKSQLMEWLRLVDADGETDPRPAVGLGLGLRPDAIFLLSDGAFPDGTVEAIARLNRRRVPIHCIDLSGGEAGDQLQRIAQDNGGRYVARP